MDHKIACSETPSIVKCTSLSAPWPDVCLLLTYILTSEPCDQRSHLHEPRGLSSDILINGVYSLYSDIFLLRFSLCSLV